MTKEYFSHDYGTRNKKKMAVLLHEQKAKGYGLFWIIVEMLHEGAENWMELDELTYIAIEKESGESSEYVKEFIEKCIHRYKVFEQKENRFTTERVLRNIDLRLEIKEKRAEAGRASAEARKQKATNDQHVLNKSEHVLNNDEQNATKERKGKESKGNNYLRPKGLTAAFAADPAEVKALKGEYDTLVGELEQKDNVEIWNSVKGFVQEKHPTFVEPYIDLWNIFALSNRLIKKPIQLTDHRRKKFDTRIREPGFDFVEILHAIKKSAFLKGSNDRNWKVSFEYIIDSQEKYTKILEEKYD